MCKVSSHLVKVGVRSELVAGCLVSSELAVNFTHPSKDVPTHFCSTGSTDSAYCNAYLPNKPYSVIWDVAAYSVAVYSTCNGNGKHMWPTLAGVGQPLSPERTRALLALRINVLSKGYSGISVQTLHQLIDAFNGKTPCVGSMQCLGLDASYHSTTSITIMTVKNPRLRWNGRPRKFLCNQL